MPKFNVHVFTMARVRVDGVEAASMEEAIAKVRNDTDWYHTLRCGAEWCEDFEGYLVDPYDANGELDTERSEFFADESHVENVLQNIKYGVKRA